MYKIEETIYLQASIAFEEANVVNHFCIQLTEHFRLLGYWHQEITIIDGDEAGTKAVLYTLEGLMNRKNEVIIDWTMYGPAEKGNLFFRWPLPDQTTVEIKSTFPKINSSEVLTATVLPAALHLSLAETFQQWNSFFTNKYRLHDVLKSQQKGNFTKALKLAHEVSQGSFETGQIITHVKAAIEKGFALVQLGRYEEAEGVLKECIQWKDQLDPTTKLLLQSNLLKCAIELQNPLPDFYTPQHTYLPEFKQWYYEGYDLYLAKKYPEAIDVFVKTLAEYLTQETPDWMGICNLYRNLAGCYLELNRLEQALNFIESSITAALTHQLYPLLSSALTFKGLILQKNQAFSSAEAAFLNAIEWATRYNPDKVWSIHHHLAKCYVTMRAYSQAENAYEMAIQSIENQRALLQKDDNRIGYYEMKVGVYQDYVHFKLLQKKYKEAFDLLQRARSRALLDLLQERHGRSGNQATANYAEIKASLV